MKNNSPKGIIEQTKNNVQSWWCHLSQDWKLCIGSIIVLFIFICCICLVCIESLTPMFFLKQWSNIAELIFPICTACFIVSATKNRKFFKSHAFYFSWILSFIFFLPQVPTYFGYGTTQIGDFYEKKEYMEDYIVIMSREPETQLDRKEYTLPATIIRTEDYIGTTISNNWLSGDILEREIYEHLYHIDKLYFPNGGYLTFKEEYNMVYLDEEVKLYDRHDNPYYITLTDQMYNN